MPIPPGLSPGATAQALAAAQGEGESDSNYASRLIAHGVAPQNYPGASWFNLGSPTGIPPGATTIGPYTNIHHFSDDISRLTDTGFDIPNKPVYISTDPQVGNEVAAFVDRNTGEYVYRPGTGNLMPGRVATNVLAGAMETVPGVFAGGRGEAQALLSAGDANRAFGFKPGEAGAIQRAKIGPVDLGINTNTMDAILSGDAGVSAADRAKWLAGKGARLFGPAGAALGAKAVLDRFQNEQYARMVMAGGSMLPGVGPVFLAGEMAGDVLASPPQPVPDYVDPEDIPAYIGNPETWATRDNNMAVTPAQATAVRLGLQASPEHFAESQAIENRAAAGEISGATADALKGQNLMETRFSPAIAAASAYPYQIGQEVFRDVRDQGISGLGSGFLRGAQAGWNNLRGMGAGLYNLYNPSNVNLSALSPEVEEQIARDEAEGLFDVNERSMVQNPYSTWLDPTRDIDNVTNLGYSPEALGVLSGAPVRWGNQPSGISGGARDSGEHNILSIQNTLETAADPGPWDALKGYFRLPTAEDRLNMARMNLAMPGTPGYGRSGIEQQSARQILPVMEGMINQQQQSIPETGYMQQGAHPWSALLGALYGEEIGTTPHLGGVVWEKGDEGAWTGRPPERFLDYLGDTPEERVQEQRDMLALQREISGYVPPEPLGQIFRGDTGVGTDLQFTPEEAMTSNVSNALIDRAYGRDVQPELQAITELAEVDPTFNFEKYLDPTSQEVMDITTQEESFSAIQEADQKRMERERADNRRAADEAAARQEQVRADNQRRADEAREAQDRARENRERQEAQAERARAIAERSKAADDRKSAARAQARADAAAKRERQAAIQRKESQKRKQATERAAANQRRAAQQREQAARAKEAAARAQQQSRAQAAAAAARARSQAAARARNIAAEARRRGRSPGGAPGRPGGR